MGDFSYLAFPTAALRMAVERFLSQLAGRCHAGTVPEGANY